MSAAPHGAEVPDDSDEPVGSLAEETARLFDALLSDPPEGSETWSGRWADRAAGAAHGLNHHLATGADECSVCPLCRGVRMVRGASPEVRAHLTDAAASLLQAAAAMLAAPSQAEQTRTDQPGDDE